MDSRQKLIASGLDTPSLRWRKLDLGSIGDN